MVKKVIIYCLLPTAYCLLFTVYCFADTPKYIRVAISQNISSLNLCVRGGYQIVEADNLKILSDGRNLKTTVAASKGGIIIGQEEYKNRFIIIDPRMPEEIEINGRQFRGKIEFILKDNDCLLVVNIVELEDYIKGILYNEVSHYWPMDALKAQAIASRSYAVYHMQENKLRDYDVTCDASQFYGGRASERYRTDQAVDETKDEALIYQNKVVPSYFYTTCGGRTEDAALLWNIDLAPLKGVICGFCAGSPHFKWHCVLSLEEIKNKLIKSGLKVSDIKGISIVNKDKSGRIKELKIVSSDNEVKVLSKDFRNAIGPNIIKSTNFKAEIMDSDAVFEGFGWGHGAGMCQWGAYFMAKKGFNYKDILKHYYPGSKIKLLTNS